MPTEVGDLTDKEYRLIARLVYAKSGINLGDSKKQLVRARLGKRVREGGFKSFGHYLRHVEQDPTGEELCQLLDAISTNTTHLFREIRHFDLLGKFIERWSQDSKWRQRNSTLRIWSAGCSSGEEPHSIAMVVYDALQRCAGLKAKILATDLSVQMLSKAKLGIYEPHRIGTAPETYRKRYFRRTQVEGHPALQIVPEVRKLITFSHFNLMTPKYPFRYGFQVIFCRNVMIYFDKQTQEALVRKFTDCLHEGGHLMIGHSESLNGINHSLVYTEPTVYRKGQE